MIPQCEMPDCENVQEWEVRTPYNDDFEVLVCTDHISSVIAVNKSQYITYGVYGLP